MLAKVFNKGQIVIPAILRKKYNIGIGDKVNIIEEDNGIKIVPIREAKSILALAGIFSEYLKEEISDEKINAIIEDEFVGSFANEIY